MTALDELARFVHELDLDALSPETIDRLELHLLDSVAAIVAGAELDEARALAGLAPADDVLALVAAARATEMDDIHLASCTTPGSVVVGTALSLVAEGVITTPRSLLSSLAAGYELIVRAGLAIDGASVLGKGIWPTLYAAPLGSAAVAARAFGLSAEQTAGALATALALGSGTPIRSFSPSTSRWLTLGAASRQGVLSARAAVAGVLGTPALLEQLDFRIAGVAIAPETLSSGLGERWMVDELCLKPYPIARQALAAVEACRELAASHDLPASAIDAVVVAVSEEQRRVIDRPEIPETRFASIVSVQYLAALAIAAPERLLDVRRAPPFVDENVRTLMTKVRVEADAGLARHYPQKWPARVEVRSGDKRFERELLSPRGDAASGFGWDDVAAKLSPVSAGADFRSFIENVRALHEASELPRFPLPVREARRD